MQADLQDFKYKEITNRIIKIFYRVGGDHEAQLLDYLQATNIEAGLLLNLGPKPEVKRKAFNNKRK